MCVRVFDAFDATITIEMDYLAITIQCNGWMGFGNGKTRLNVNSS